MASEDNGLPEKHRFLPKNTNQRAEGIRRCLSKKARSPSKNGLNKSGPRQAESHLAKLERCTLRNVPLIDSSQPKPDERSSLLPPEKNALPQKQEGNTRNTGCTKGRRGELCPRRKRVLALRWVVVKSPRKED